VVAQGISEESDRVTLPARATNATVLTPRSQKSIEQIAAGLAAIAIQPSLKLIFGEAVALLARLPAVGTVAVIRRDDHGLLNLTQQTGVPIPEPLVAAATSAIHQQWIASHARDGEPTGPAPFALSSRDDVLLVPMVSGDALLGGFILVGKNGIPPAAGSAERVSAAAVGTVTAQAIENLLARQRAAAAVSQLTHESMQLDVRKSLGRELHDGPTQELALAGITLDRLVRNLGPEQAVSADARQARDLIDKAVNGMRSIIGKMRTQEAPAPSATGPLRALIAEMAPTSPNLALDISEVSGVRLAPEVERAMMGIVREALHNVRKHARAEEVRLEVRRVDDHVEIAVVDDGVGLNGRAADGHFGLEQIRELAEETGGSIEIGSAGLRGTSVRARIPMDAQMRSDDVPSPIPDQRVESAAK
jgi:signal transduction histidine kinase